MLLDRYATYTGSDPRRAPAALAVVPYVELALRRLVPARRPAHPRRRAGPPGDRARRPDPHRHRRWSGSRPPAAGPAGCGSPTAAGCRPTWWSPTPTPATSTATCCRSPRRLRRLRRRTPSLSGFVLLLGVRGRTPGLAHHNVLFPGLVRRRVRRGLRRPGRARSAGPDRLRQRRRRPAPSARTATRPGSCWSTRPGTATARARWTGTRPGSPSSYADRLLGMLARRGLDGHATGCCSRDVLTPADLERPTRAPGGAIYGTLLPTAPPAFLRPPNRVPGAAACSWSAAPPTPAAACPWSPCPPGSSPTSSARPEPVPAGTYPPGTSGARTG